MSGTFRKAYRPLTSAEQRHMEQIKTQAEELEASIRALPMSREVVLGLTKLEEAVMWVVKGLTK